MVEVMARRRRPQPTQREIVKTALQQIAEIDIELARLREQLTAPLDASAPPLDDPYERPHHDDRPLW
jgi:hypothetical protein